ncbi:PQQ-dependent sugar dehydrogenase [Plantactinospora siamensis]|uniref:PQQ-dependent sugar dehydrogenase n=1 Tax=Plantactinospora siamensis TaxID=555372 RepID=A0ABV6NR29_9ACTN
MSTNRIRGLVGALVLLLAVLINPGVAAATLPVGFTDQLVFGGLTEPTAVAFSPDGRVFVAEKSGLIKVFASLTAKTPTIFADLRTNVYDYEDLGLIGLALPPGFPTSNPYVYVSYTYDAPIGGRAPVYHDTCAVLYNCLTSGRLSRLRASGNVSIGEQVLINDWCQQSDTHSMGDILFGPDGALYVGGGDGGSGDVVDYGQLGSPSNPCADPPSPVGGPMTPPTAQGGALRAQSLRSSGPARLNGTIIRVNPATGAAMPGNPLISNPNQNARRIVAYGLRNPFRMVFRPGTNEVWIGDVGYHTWEEIDRVLAPTASPVRNYGWPCYEGAGRQPEYDATNLNLCESLYAAGPSAVVAPAYSYQHGQAIVAGDGCRTTGGAITGVAFYPASLGNYPARYKGGLFFTDLLRQCIWSIRPGSGGVPNPNYIEPFGSTVGAPVQLKLGPDCNLYYVSITNNSVRRYVYKTGSTSSCPV